MPIEGAAFAAGFGRLLHAAAIWLSASIVLLGLCDRNAAARWSNLLISALLSVVSGYLAVQLFSGAGTSVAAWLLAVASFGGIALSIRSCKALTQQNNSGPDKGKAKALHARWPEAVSVTCLTAAAGGFVLRSRLLDETATVAAVSIAHQLVTCVFAAVCLCCSLRLTWLDTTSKEFLAGMKSVRTFALGALLVELAVCQIFFFNNLSREQWANDLPAAEVRLLLASHGYVLTLLPIAWICWMIPHRIQQLLAKTHGKKDKPKAADWVSLALAAWILLLVLALSASLPWDWPWNAIK